MAANLDVSITHEGNFIDSFPFDKKVKSITWLDEPNKEAKYEQENGMLTVHSEYYRYGRHLVVRVAKIVTE